MSGSRMTDLAFGVAVAGLGLWVWFFSRGFPSLRGGHPGPGLFPGILAWLMVFAGLALVWVALRSRTQAPSGFAIGRSWQHIAEVFLISALALAYPLLNRQLGFLPTASVLIFGVALVLRARWYVAALVAVAAAGLIYLGFTRLLGVPL